MATYGRGSSDVDAGIVQNQGRVSVFDPIGVNGWGWRMGGRIGRNASSGTAAVRFAIYDTAGTGGSPDDLVGRTAEFSVTNTAFSAGSCTEFVADINAAPGSPDNNAVMLYAGRTYAMGYISTGASLLHQMIQAASAGYDNETFYNKTGLGSTTPPDPYAANSTQYEGMLNVYIEYETNAAPLKPDSGFAPSGFISTLTPTFTADFDDANEDHGDYVTNIDIEVRQTGTSTYKWNTALEPSASEVSGAKLNRAYGGSALTAGVAYEWRVRFADAFGAWGEWANWLGFTVNAGGTVLTPTAPTGKQETQSPTPFTAVWDHATGLSTNAAEIRIKQGATIVRGPFQKAVTVADLGTISFTFAETAFTALEWGKTYTVEIRARDTAALWSPWSTGKTFNTNAQPTKPVPVAPANGVTTSTLPLIEFTFTDDDTVGTGLTAEVRIKNAAGALLFTRTATLNTTTGRWQYQTTVTDCASFATYKWDARGYDGTVYGTYSDERSFLYGAGPSITAVLVNGVAANGATPATNTPVITWTVSLQQSFRVRLYLPPYGGPSDTPIYDSGTIVSATASHTIPSGFLHNAVAYVLVVTVTNTTPLTGDSSPATFTVTFAAPSVYAGFQASAIAIAGDVAGQTSAILLSWNTPEDPPATFIAAVLTRQIIGKPETLLTIAEMTSIDQTSFIDYFPRTEFQYEYQLYKIVYQGTDLTESAPVSANASVTFDHAIIQSAADPSSRRIALRVTQSTGIDHKGEETLLFPWGESKPTIVVSPIHYHTVTGSYLLYTSPSQNAEDALEALNEIEEAHEIVCYRDERGKKIFGTLTFKEDYAEMRRYNLSLAITESNFKEGVP